MNLYNGGSGFIPRQLLIMITLFLGSFIGCTDGGQCATNWTVPDIAFSAQPTCYFIIPEWISASGCYSFYSGIQYSSLGNMISFVLKGNAYAMYIVWNETNIGGNNESIVTEYWLGNVFSATPSTFPVSLVVQYLNGYFQLEWALWVGTNGPIFSSPFAFYVPKNQQDTFYTAKILPWAQNTSSLLSYPTCYVNKYPSIPYIPNELLQFMVPCSPLPFFQSNDLPLAYGSYYTFDLYLSMSGSCDLQLTVVLGCDKVVVVMETLTQQNIQSMSFNGITSFAGTALYNKLSPTSIWIAVDACGLFYVGKVGVVPITSVFNVMMMGLVPDEFQK